MPAQRFTEVVKRSAEPAAAMSEDMGAGRRVAAGAAAVSPLMRKRLLVLMGFFGFFAVVLAGGLAKASWLLPMPMHRIELLVCVCVKSAPDALAGEKAFVEEAMHAAALVPGQHRE